jgi:hypothetical protein
LNIIQIQVQVAAVLSAEKTEMSANHFTENKFDLVTKQTDYQILK